MLLWNIHKRNPNNSQQLSENILDTVTASSQSQAEQMAEQLGLGTIYDIEAVLVHPEEV